MITMVLGYYRCPNLLKMQLETWNKWPTSVKDQVQIILVDDASPIKAEIPLNTHLNLDLYRILKNIPWNNEGAKNLGACMACTEWILFCDMDYLMDGENMHQVLQLDRSDPKTWYCFRSESKRKGRWFYRHPKAVPFINKKTFFSVGGYYEDFRGNVGKAANQLPIKLKRYHAHMEVLESPQWTQVMPNECADAAYDGSADNWTYNRQINNILFYEKMYGLKSFNKEIIRFPWEKVASWTTSPL